MADVTDDLSVDVSNSLDHGQGRLGRAADALLATTTMPAADGPVLALLYNAMPDPPGPLEVGRLPVHEELWALTAPDLLDYVDLLTGNIRASRLRRRPTAADGRSRLDGIAMVYPALSLDNRTNAGRALLANIEEGHYRHGDIAASPYARRSIVVTALDRTGVTVMLTKGSPWGGAVDLIPQHLRRSTPIQVRGRIGDSLGALLGALYDWLERAE